METEGFFSINDAGVDDFGGHPEDRPRGLVNGLGVFPTGFDGGQPEVADFDGEVVLVAMQEDVV